MTKQFQRWLRLVGILAVGLGAAGGYWGYVAYHRLPRRFATVEPNVLYRSGQPTPQHIDRLISEYDLRTLLVVRKGDGKRVPAEIDYARQKGVNVVHIPIDSRRPVSDAEIERFFECVDDPANQPVLVHCAAGRHRTGLVCALYRIERQGWTVDQALEEMLSFGYDRESQSAIEKQLRAYVPRRDRKGAGSVR